MKEFTHPATGRPIKLGRRQRSVHTKHSMAKALAMHRFIYSLPPAPAVLDSPVNITAWGMMLNDEHGDCTIACLGHLIQQWTACAGAEQTVSDLVILGAYESWCGYVNGDPSTDNGGIISVVLQDWEQQRLGGYGILAHAPVELTDQRINQTIYILGGADGGVALPISAQSQVGSTWDVVGDGKTGDSAPGSWGLHCTAIVPPYDAETLTCVTWGATQAMTRRFFAAYYDELQGIVSPNWKSPYSTATLESDLLSLSGEGTIVPVSFPPFVVNP